MAEPPKIPARTTGRPRCCDSSWRETQGAGQTNASGIVSISTCSRLPRDLAFNGEQAKERSDELIEGLVGWRRGLKITAAWLPPFQRLLLLFGSYSSATW
jgi:hypothetical protein